MRSVFRSVDFFNIVFDIRRTVSITPLRNRTAGLWAGDWGSTPPASASIGQISILLLLRRLHERGAQGRGVYSGAVL